MELVEHSAPLMGLHGSVYLHSYRTYAKVFQRLGVLSSALYLAGTLLRKSQIGHA